MRPIILFILFTCISCAKETDFLFEREINYSRLDSFVHEPDRMHYIIMPIDIPILNFIGSEGTIAVKMLKNELSSKFNSEEDQLRGSYSFF